jgi:hypothetical protein
MLPNTPNHLFLRMDWTHLQELKAYCLNEAANRPEVRSIYGSIIALFENLQRTAVDAGFASPLTVYGDSPPRDG